MFINLVLRIRTFGSDVIRQTPGIAYGLVVVGCYAYVADEASLQAIDVTNPMPYHSQPISA
jgi:hypothetical protein